MDFKSAGIWCGVAAMAAGAVMLAKRSSSRAERRGCSLCEGQDPSCPVCVEGAVLIDVPESMSASERMRRVGRKMRHRSWSRSETEGPRYRIASMEIEDDDDDDVLEGAVIEAPSRLDPSWTTFYRVETRYPVTTYTATFADPKLEELVKQEEAEAQEAAQRIAQKRRLLLK